MESDCLLLMEQVQDTLGAAMEESSCILDRGALRTTRELIQVSTVGGVLSLGAMHGPPVSRLLMLGMEVGILEWV